MPLPKIAIVGRPNVGKSTFFNRLIGKKEAIVYDLPGVTRDRHYGICDWDGSRFEVIDTGGYDLNPATSLLEQMRKQVEEGIREADLILWVVDGKSALTNEDYEVAKKLRKVSKKTFLVVNKIDNASQENDLSDFYALGFSEVFPISSEHGRRVSEVLVAAKKFLSPSPSTGESQISGTGARGEGENPQPRIKVALLGRPNVGKSTLLNTLYGAPRAVVHDVPGTTRDPLDIEVEEEGCVYQFVDTAGIRKKSHSEGKIEKVSVLKTLEQVAHCDVALLLLDATDVMTTQDAKVLQMITSRFRPMLILVNKWDLVPGEDWAKFQKEILDRFGFTENYPLQKISAKKGTGLSKIYPLIQRVYQESSKKLSTSEINELLQDLLQKHPPPMVSGRSLNLFYMTQIGIRPPHFVILANHPKLVPESYKRYLLRGIRNQFSFLGTPLKFTFKPRRKKQFHR
ncbi:MAG: ribosome biogenesis GTPase Der [Deltaproteobacteria bacterium]|nr:ribosome biogenesis GTPase Der [Deltaproteobacteria bacterium]